MAERDSVEADGRLLGGGEGLPVSRRAFLAASSVAVGAGATVERLERDDVSLEARPPEDVVLRQADLAVPPGGEYVRDESATEDPRLIGFLETTISGFGTASSAARAFAATDDTGVPKYVESAAVSLPEGVLPGVVALKTGTWLTERYEGTDAIVSFDHETDSFAEEWHSTTTEGWRDVLRLTNVGDGLLTFAVAYGRMSSAQTPAAAVDHYADTMERRAFERV